MTKLPLHIYVIRSSERDQSSNPTAAAIEAMSSATGGERGVSRGGSRGGKPNTATPDIALSGVAAVSRPGNSFSSHCVSLIVIENIRLCIWN